MLEINQKSLTVPLIQGGMGVGVSLGSLAGHVAKCGAMGVISTAHPGYKECNSLIISSKICLTGLIS